MTQTPISSNSTGKRIGMVSLGCPKALVDSENILSALKREGYDLSNDYHEANAVIVNTCGFIDSAKQESLDTIAEALQENGQVIVTGCMAKDADDIKRKYPHVVSISGPGDVNSVVTSVKNLLPLPQPSEGPFIDLIPSQGIKLTPRHYAYLKISEGCNNTCRFCIIPDLRGKLVSRSIDAILSEAQTLADSGVKELLIISQDTSAYGVDLSYQTIFFQGRPLKTNIHTLCQELSKLGLWIRLHYLYPYPHLDALLPMMADGSILPYIDVPFQHASPALLKLMKRPASTENLLKRIAHWRDVCPHITLRSTFIVGHPGETEDDFAYLIDFLHQAQLDRVGCFQYSAVEGAQANVIEPKVAEDIKQQRWEHFMQTAQRISAEKLAQKIGTTQPIIIDSVNQDQAIGRTRGDAPEIDGVVYLNQPPATFKPGDIIKATITDADAYDLWANSA